MAQPTGYDYGKQIKIKHEKIAGSDTLLDFPFLFVTTDSDLKTTSNGGKVEDSNGYDITFTQDDCATSYDFQIEDYDGATGDLVVWIKLDTLLPDTNTFIHMYYGNDSATTNQSKTSTWSGDYDGVWHMDNDPGSDSLIDYSGNGVDGESNGSMTSSDLVSGKIGDCVELDGTDDFFSLSTKVCSTAGGIQALTLSAWINTSYSGYWYNNWSIIDWDRSENFNMFIDGHGRMAFCSSASRSQYNDIYAGDTGDYNDGKWHYFTAVFEDYNKYLYVDGQLETTEYNPHGGGIGTGSIRYGYIGDGSESTTYNSSRNGFYYEGKIDEVRVLHEARSADWIETEYNNQNEPDSFYNVGFHKTASNVCNGTILPITLLSFDATVAGSQVLLEWQTASETNNDFFTVERSKDGIGWEEVGRVDGALRSTLILSYDLMDTDPHVGVSYYRLKQTDLDGNMVFSANRSVEITSLVPAVVIYPNPANGMITIEGNDDEIRDFRLYNSLGQDVRHLLHLIQFEKDAAVVDLSNLAPGLYTVKTANKAYKVFLQ
jgi:hypothetical protein